MTYPIVPCLDCPDYGYCRRTESFLSCDKYLNWRKERGYSQLQVSENMPCRICGSKIHTPWVHLSDKWTPEKREMLIKYLLLKYIQEKKVVA